MTEEKQPDYEALSGRELWVAAAHGDILAQRIMCDYQVTVWLRSAEAHRADGETLVRGDALDLAELWARIMAEHSDCTLDDVYSLVKVLTLAAGDDFSADDYGYAAEALGILSVLADQGNEECSQMVNDLTAKLPPHAIEKAKVHGKFWGASKVEEPA